MYWSELVRTSKLYFWLSFRWLRRTRGIWLRAILCWTIGMTISLLDSSPKFDLRFQLRGPQPVNDRIVLVYLSKEDWMGLSGEGRNLLHSLKDTAPQSDSFYWNPWVWERLMRTLLRAEPSAVAVSFFFPMGSIGLPFFDENLKALFDPRVMWAARLDNDGRAILPAFSANYGHNSGLIDFFADEDRTVRRFASPLVQIPHLAVRLAALFSHNAENGRLTWLAGETRIINFFGANDTFPSIRASDLIRNQAQALQLLKGRMVILGSRDLEGHLYVTPTGTLTRAELLANVTENILSNRWIYYPSIWILALYLLIIVALVVSILLIYPQAVAFVMTVWLSIGVAVLSFWSFDRFQTWLPLSAALGMVGVTYLLFLGYQLTQQENLNWRLEEEKRYLQEIEQLKNNFVSLFSHDLKTPIAKIQAICDRLMLAASPSPDVQNGLVALRRESSELHRYIQSILRVSRIESADFKINKEPSDVNELIFAVCQQLRPLADARHIRLDTNLEPIFAIEIDPTLIQEVILNLVENGIKYSPDKATVLISSREVGDQVIVTVTDTGPGIPTSEQSRIFEKFYRSPSQNSTKGSGLGLYLVKYFVELHGGRVFVRSHVSQGTRIGFALPLHEVEQTISQPKVFENERIASLDR